MENTTSNPQPTQRPEMAPNNHLTWAIISTILCCWPFGVAAIVNSTKVDKYWTAGYKEEAYKAAADAKKWADISLYVAIACWVIYILLVVVATLLGMEM